MNNSLINLIVPKISLLDYSGKKNKISFLDFSVMEPPLLKDKILIFAPHPDDEVLSAGGFIALAKINKALVKIIIVTDGNKRNLKKKRYKETLKAVEILGIKNKEVVFLNYPDGKLKDYRQNLSKSISQLVVRFKPTIIISPYPFDTHSDHKVLSLAVRNILKGLKYNGKIFEYLIHFPRYPQPRGLYENKHLIPPVFLLGLDNKKRWCQLPLSFEIKKLKTKAISQYKSQLRFPMVKNLLLSFIKKNELFYSWR